MNDPGLDDPIANETRVIDQRNQSDEQDEAEEDEQFFLRPRCAFLSSAARCYPRAAGAAQKMVQIGPNSLCKLDIIRILDMELMEYVADGGSRPRRSH
jgi:hypothetical protein